MRTSKKILFVVTKSNLGGAQQYVYDLACHAKGDYTVSAAMGNEGTLSDRLKEHDIRTHFINGMVRDIGFARELKALAALYRLFRDERPDVIHLNSSKAGVLGALAGRACGIPRIIFTAHGWPFHEKRAWWWRAFIWFGSWVTALLCHKVICVSHYDAQHTYMPFIHKKLHVVHNGIATFPFKERTEARDALFSKEAQQKHAHDLWLVTNAELTQNKNLFTGIEAVSTYNKEAPQNIYYSIMSDGELKEQLEAYIKKCEAEEYITLLGFVKNARAYLRAFDLFLLPSKKEGLPYALLEAGITGLPSIASNVGGIPEIITHEKNGLLIDPFDPSSITQALTRLTSDTHYRNTLGAELKRTIEDRFSIERMRSETFSLYT